MILKYLQFKYALIPVCKQNVTYSIDQPSGQWVGMVDGVVVKDFATEDLAVAWLEKIKAAIGGGDVIVIIDDY